MKQDCTISLSTADETQSFHTTESEEFLKGKYVTESDIISDSEIKKYSEKSTAWSYMFVHNQKVKTIEEQLIKDRVTHFIHKTIKYIPHNRNGSGVREIERPSVSGLIFLQGDSYELQKYLDENLMSRRLCKDCSTGEVARIPNNQMEPFMRVAESDPERLRFLLRPFAYYSKNRTLLRIISGDYAGLEGYVIRIARDRRLVLDVGGMAVAISGIHAERFEEVSKNGADKKECATFYKRNLHERNAFIDRYFHQVKTAQEVAAQAENIDILCRQTLKDVIDNKLDMRDAFDTFYFMIEEIGYYYAPFIDYFKDDLKPIFVSGAKVIAEMENLIEIFKNRKMGDRYQHLETELEELRTKYGYLFE